MPTLLALATPVGALHLIATSPQGWAAVSSSHLHTNQPMPLFLQSLKVAARWLSDPTSRVGPSLQSRPGMKSSHHQAYLPTTSFPEPLPIFPSPHSHHQRSAWLLAKSFPGTIPVPWKVFEGKLVHHSCNYSKGNLIPGSLHSAMPSVPVSSSLVGPSKYQQPSYPSKSRQVYDTPSYPSCLSQLRPHPSWGAKARGSAASHLPPHCWAQTASSASTSPNLLGTPEFATADVPHSELHSIHPWGDPLSIVWKSRAPHQNLPPSSLKLDCSAWWVRGRTSLTLWGESLSGSSPCWWVPLFALLLFPLLPPRLPLRSAHLWWLWNYASSFSSCRGDDLHLLLEPHSLFALLWTWTAASLVSLGWRHGRPHHWPPAAWSLFVGLGLRQRASQLHHFQLGTSCFVSLVGGCQGGILGAYQFLMSRALPALILNCSL